MIILKKSGMCRGWLRWRDRCRLIAQGAEQNPSYCVLRPLKLFLAFVVVRAPEVRRRGAIGIGARRLWCPRVRIFHRTGTRAKRLVL